MITRFAPLVLALTGLAFAGCSSDSTPSSSSEPDVPLTLTYSDSPVSGLPDGTRFVDGVPYAKDETGMQVIDAFLPASDKPTGVVVYIHGGGFVEGDRKDVYGGDAAWVHQTLDAGFAFVSVEYRLLKDAGVETEGVIKSLKDCRRALQFVRHHATELNVDPNRIGLTGVSAGAGTSLWLAYHDDMANPSSTDGVDRESTRPQAVGVLATQSTYDVVRWADDVFAKEYSIVSVDLFLSQAPLRKMLVQFYGLDIALADDKDALYDAAFSDKMVKYRADVDMLALMTPDDPPTYFINPGADQSPADADFDLLHHPLHAKALYEQSKTNDSNVSADVQAYQISSGIKGDDTAIQFLLEKLK